MKHKSWGRQRELMLCMDFVQEALAQIYPVRECCKSHGSQGKGVCSHVILSSRKFVQQLAAQIPWFHNCHLLERVDEPMVCLWYARKAQEEPWCRNVLAMKIESHLRERQLFEVQGA